ncbi:MAG: hypothetical protein PHI28_09220 [Mangrovibacterium sp.]|nr:hypothetical protein [Mangrovibacterium sp.]
MDDERNDFDQLVSRYLNGHLEDREYDQLLRLLRDQGNLSRFDRLKNNWDTEKDARSLKNWERLARRIRLTSTDPGVKKLTIYQPWIVRAAAVLIFGLLITTVVLYRKNQVFVGGVTVIETPRGESRRSIYPTEQKFG